MKIAIIGASGKTGTALVHAALKRGHHVVAVCRAQSVSKLDTFADHKDVAIVPASQVSDPSVLNTALAGCDGVVGILISVSGLKASAMIEALSQATHTNAITRVAFTAGEITVMPEPGETLSLRQRSMQRVFGFISRFTPYSLSDMIKASQLIRQHPAWRWTIVRAPTLVEGPETGYQLCQIDDVTSQHSLSRADYAACLIDSLENPDRHRRTLTVVPA